MYTYHHTKTTQNNRLALGIILLLVAAGFTWFAVTRNGPLVEQIGYIVLAAIASGNAIRMGMALLSSKPTLTINSEGIAVGGWPHTVRWGEIGQAKVATKELQITPNKTTKVVCLTLYGKEEPDKVVGEVANFDKFEKTSEIVQRVSEHLGQPVLLGESLRTEHTPTRDAQVEQVLSKADLEARIANGLCPKCGNQITPTDQNCPSCRVNLAWARQNLDQLG